MEKDSVLWFHVRRAWLGAHARYTLAATGTPGEGAGVGCVTADPVLLLCVTEQGRCACGGHVHTTHISDGGPCMWLAD